MQMDKLSALLLRKLIDQIDVFETKGSGKNPIQRIVIYYRFIGYIELPNMQIQNYTEDTHKGVSIEYITKSA